MRTSFAESWFALLIAAATLPTPAHADDPRATPAPRGYVAIIIDDLGEQHLGGLHAARLPGPVALAFLPGAPYTVHQAALAHARGKEVLLHLPMQPAGPARAHPASLTADADPAQLREYFRVALASVPYAAGVNNHQGSLMTTREAPMDGLMREISLRPGLYFVDSRTTAGSVAYRSARLHGVPSTERNVFLDAQRGEKSVRAEFARLVAKALRDDRALAIGHPYPETFKVLEEELPQLAARYGVRLVAPSELIARQSGWRGPYRPSRPGAAPMLTAATPSTRTPLPAHRAARSVAAR
ncbi:MAG: divergent polysaccharide deacetylase family protein [Nevskiaceae bacterium]